MKIARKMLASLAAVVGLSTLVHAGEVSIDVYGLSYHLKKNESYYNAPRSVGSSDGQWVFSPGIGLDYDFRTKGSMGFSGYTTLGYFRDCGDYPFYFAGLGVKYRNYIIGSKSVFWSFQLAGAVADAEDWTTTNAYNSTQRAIDYGRTTEFLPVGGLSLGYQFENKDYLSYTITYVPQNNNAGATSGTNLLFMWLSFGF